MTSLSAIISQAAVLVLIEILNLSAVEARRSSSRYRSRYASYYSGSGGDSTEAIIAVSVIMGMVAFIVIFLLLKAKCCPYWSPIDSIAECTASCRECKVCSRKDSKIRIAPSRPIEITLKKKPKNTWAPVKKHMATLRLAIHTPKPVLLKRESKKLEKDISLYETNPTHYRDYMEPPPAYEYIDPAKTEKNKKDSSEFLQNRQRISRISRTLTSMRLDQVKKAKEQLESKQPLSLDGPSRAQRSGQPANKWVVTRTLSGDL